MAPGNERVADDLRASLGSDRVFDDEITLRTYSTDASPCFVVPKAVVLPRSEDEVIRTVRLCAKAGVPVTPRAAGTSLSGAAIGPGVILDVTRLSSLEFDAAASRVRAGPGLPILELNARLKDRGAYFPIEPGSREWCRIGGMVGHNASGYQSVKYGQMRDHVLGLRVVLADGTVLEARDVLLDGPAWRHAVAQVPALESIRADLEDHRDAILRSRRPVKKHACGMDLARIAARTAQGVFPLADLFLGSEGTLGIVTEATLKVVPAPAAKVTLLLLLERFDDLGPLVRELRPLGPSALEGIDGDSLDVLGRDAHGIPPTARALLLVEFDEGDLDAIADRVIRTIAPRYALSAPAEVASDPARQAALWAARRALFPTLIRRPGRRRPWGFVEDPIVPAEAVPDFIRFLSDLAHRHGTVAGIYGHLGDGNTHYRPVFDPTDPEDFERMLALRREFDDALLDRFHGAPSGEHGIGRIRGETLPRVWGDEVYGVLQRTKAALDPGGLLNPGVLLTSAPWYETWGGLESREPQ